MKTSSFIYIFDSYTFHETRKISYCPSLCMEAFLTSWIQSAKPWERDACGSWTCFSWETQAVDCQLHYYTVSLLLFVLYSCDCTCKWLVCINSLCVSVFARSFRNLICILSYSIELRSWNIHLQRGYMMLTVPQHHAGALGPDSWSWGHLPSCTSITLPAPTFINAPGP